MGYVVKLVFVFLQSILLVKLAFPMHGADYVDFLGENLELESLQEYFEDSLTTSLHHFAAPRRVFALYLAQASPPDLDETDTLDSFLEMFVEVVNMLKYFVDPEFVEKVVLTVGLEDSLLEVKNVSTADPFHLPLRVHQMLLCLERPKLEERLLPLKNSLLKLVLSFKNPSLCAETNCSLSEKQVEALFSTKLFQLMAITIVQGYYKIAKSKYLRSGHLQRVFYKVDWLQLFVDAYFQEAFYLMPSQRFFSIFEAAKIESICNGLMTTSRKLSKLNPSLAEMSHHESTKEFNRVLMKLNILPSYVITIFIPKLLGICIQKLCYHPKFGLEYFMLGESKIIGRLARLSEKFTARYDFFSMNRSVEQVGEKVQQAFVHDSGSLTLTQFYMKLLKAFYHFPSSEMYTQATFPILLVPVGEILKFLEIYFQDPSFELDVLAQCLDRTILLLKHPEYSQKLL